MSNTPEHECEGFPVVGWETNRYFLLDIDKFPSLEEIENIAFEIGYKYWLGNCLVVLSSLAVQLTLDGVRLQNYNLIYGREVSWWYQQRILRELDESRIIGDIRYIRFRELEKTSTLRISPKHECKLTGKPVAFVEITGENEGIREYLLLLNIGRQVEQYLREVDLLETNE